MATEYIWKAINDLTTIILATTKRSRRNADDIKDLTRRIGRIEGTQPCVFDGTICSDICSLWYKCSYHT